MKYQILMDNNSTALILIPETELEKNVVKEIGGGSNSEVRTIASGNSILQQNVEGGLLISNKKKE